MAKQPDDKGAVGLDGFLSDDLAPAFWTPDLQIEESRWWPHVPFAFWLVAAIRPRSLVELGTGRGVSYSAFCEAAVRLRLDAQFCAIDTWLGDRETGDYGKEIYKNFRAFHDRRYSSFSKLVRGSFDEARGGFVRFVDRPVAYRRPAQLRGGARPFRDVANQALAPRRRSSARHPDSSVRISASRNSSPNSPTARRISNSSTATGSV